MAAGFFVCLEFAASFGGAFTAPRFQALGHALGTIILCAAIAISVSHLGRPLYAFRAFLGLRRSWLSREIVVCGLWATLAFAATGAWALAALAPTSGLTHLLR